jgi:hypothetical protein
MKALLVLPTTTSMGFHQASACGGEVREESASPNKERSGGTTGAGVEQGV